MDWSSCSEVFHQDGSLRDIYVHGTTLKDWEAFMSFLSSSSYKLGYTSDGEAAAVPKSAEEIFADSDHAHTLTIHATGVGINCHFFTPEEIELDINPREVTSQGHLDAILEFMSELGSSLRRDVVLTEENGPEYIWLKFSADTGDISRVEIS